MYKRQEIWYTGLPSNRNIQYKVNQVYDPVANTITGGVWETLSTDPTKPKFRDVPPSPGEQVTGTHKLPKDADHRNRLSRFEFRIETSEGVFTAPTSSTWWRYEIPSSLLERGGFIFYEIIREFDETTNPPAFRPFGGVFPIGFSRDVMPFTATESTRLVPTGGSTGQVLTKPAIGNSEWLTPTIPTDILVPSSGNYVLRFVNGVAQIVSESNYRNSDMPPPTPQPTGAPGSTVQPSVSVSGDDATVSWPLPTSGGAPTYFHVQISNLLDFSTNDVDLVTTERPSTSEDLDPGDYYARVRSGNTHGFGGWSPASASFTIP